MRDGPRDRGTSADDSRIQRIQPHPRCAVAGVETATTETVITAIVALVVVVDVIYWRSKSLFRKLEDYRSMSAPMQSASISSYVPVSGLITTVLCMCRVDLYVREERRFYPSRGMFRFIRVAPLFRTLATRRTRH